MESNGKSDIQRKDDFYQFKAEVFTYVKDALTAEQLRKLNEVLNKLSEKHSFYHN